MNYEQAFVNTSTLTVVKKLQTLIQAPSITPDDAGTIQWLSHQLRELGFEVHLLAPRHGVKNLIAKRYFGPGQTLAFSGHVDVVPVNKKEWRVDPFSGDLVNGCIYGRGAADMKAGIAAMLEATEQLIIESENAMGTLYWLITSDEEGEAEYGSKAIAQYLIDQNIKLDGCLVGEPTSETSVGDTIKNGRRGAVSGRVLIKGRGGHVAYPQNTINAAHIAGELVSALAHITWWKDEAGSKTHLQVTGISVENIVDNLVPSECEVTFNIRYSHAYTSADIQDLVQSVLFKWANYISVNWERPCEPYYTGTKDKRCFLSLVEKAVADETKQYPALSTAGGTSDGRFFATGQTQVIECGVLNSTIHQANEHVPIADLEKIKRIYSNVLKDFFLNPN